MRCPMASADCRGPRGGRRRLGSDQRGTVMLEFALLLPVALFVVLLILQVTLLMVGRVFVHYSAQAAARTAITQLPRDLSHVGHGEPNWIMAAEGNIKFDAIQASAANALVPISGRVGGSGDEAESYAVAMSEYLTRRGATTPHWVDNLLADRYRYAHANTEVTLMSVEQSSSSQSPSYEALGGGAYEFGPRDAVGVQVRHRLNLSIPYVRAMFADGSNGDGASSRHYTTVTARTTLTNQGDLRDLPPAPDLPRRERDN